MMLLKRAKLIFLLSVIFWVVGFIGFAINCVTVKPQKVIYSSDAVVVLTGGPGRIEEGLRLFATGKASHLFISGVHQDVKKREIVNLWTGDVALPPCCFTLGKKAKTTTENAVETKEWASKHDIASVILVTSHYHMPRAMIEIKAALPKTDIIPHPVRQSGLEPNKKRFWTLLLSEYHKSILRWVQTRF